MKLSILIPYKEEHGGYLEKLLSRLKEQAKGKEVEVLVYGGKSYRDGGMHVGAKRNALIQESRGQYVSFVDADDLVSDDYVDRLLEGIKSGSDVVCFLVQYHKDSFQKLVKYSKNFVRDQETERCYQRMPNHLMACRRGLALRVGFRNISYGEDADYAKRLKPFLRTETVIKKVLYYYIDRGSSNKDRLRK